MGIVDDPSLAATALGVNPSQPLSISWPIPAATMAFFENLIFGGMCRLQIGQQEYSYGYITSTM
jgi:hypothetical protein